MTYADQVRGKQQLPTTMIDINALPKPTVKEGKPAVVLPDSFYYEGCDIWKYSLIGRLDLKGINFQEVKNHFEQKWKLGQELLQFVPMSRGFFIIKLRSQEAKDKIMKVEAWFFGHQKLNLIEWFPGFDAEKQRSSHASVWVTFPGLSMEFWTEKTLLTMAKSLGTPIIVDKRTLAHEYGHFAAVLVDIDFAEPATDAIHVSGGGVDFLQPVEIQKVPKFCSKCKIIGHTDQECRKQAKNNVDNQVPTQQIVAVQQRSSSEVQQGTEWKVAQRKKKGKKASKQQSSNETTDINITGDVDVEYAAKLEKAQQLEVAMAKSQAELDAVYVELTGAVVNKIPKPVRTGSTPTPLSDQLMAGEYLLKRNKFDALNPVNEMPESEADAKFRAEQELKRNRMQIMQRRINNSTGRVSQTHTVSQTDEASLTENDSLLGNCVGKGSCLTKGNTLSLYSGESSKMGNFSSKTCL
ncbi:uncharacterized protein LOC113330837 [Papaver somniferum]|uniref:uncharacterized protein LOC113330837 n=1 Tax=Papaver somniferum TaxID=3469 RepID=UPI000E702953|nr:uncharacterized protein LOC113330837 [Papaver somniferum]